MNKKFIKENKIQLREFFSKLIASIIASKGSSRIHKAIDKSPELSRKRAELVKHSRDLEKRIKQQIKDNPKLAKDIRAHYRKIGLNV
jgi:predicted transcriptional regulator|tara:strand:+ start:935 stop:1195 length:261 start_codon:yes stop_codon:yes gene_type:complete